MAADFEAWGGDSRVEMAIALPPPADFFAAATLAGWVALTAIYERHHPSGQWILEA